MSSKAGLLDLGPPASAGPVHCTLHCHPPLPSPAPSRLQHQAFVSLVSHAPDLPDGPLPAAPPGRPGLRAGPRVQPEPCVRDSPGATQATRSGEHPGVGGGGVGRSAASGTGRRRSEVGRNPSAPEPSPSQLSPVAPFHLRTGPGTAAHVLLSESPLPVCLLSDLFPAASHTVTRCPAPCWASDKPPDLGQGPQVVTSGRFFPGAWRVSYSCGTGQKAVVSVPQAAPPPALRSHRPAQGREGRGAHTLRHKWPQGHQGSGQP